MPFNGAGIFNRLFSWAADAAAGIDISSSRTDSDTNDIANAFNNCITRDGQGQPVGNLPMANFRHTGASSGVALTDYATMGQLQTPGAINWVVGGGSGDAITAVYSPALTTLVDGQLCFVRAPAPPSSTTPTFSPNGLAPRVITKFGGAPLGAGEYAANEELIFRYNLANTRWDLQNPSIYAVKAGGVGTAQLQDSAVTYAKIQNVTASRLIGNPTGGAAAPSEISLGQGLAFSGTSLLSFSIVPTIQLLTAGTNLTYTTPAGVKWIEVLVVGGGAGGGGGNSAVLSTAGGASSFGPLTANGGSGSSFNVPGAGGSSSGGYASNNGDPGNPGNGPGLNHNSTGGAGGSSCLGGGGAGSNSNATGGAAAANSGAGGGGGGSSNGSLDGAAGCGGAGAGWTRALIAAPAATYTYTIGAGGAGAVGAAINSSSGGNGGAGGSGRIEIIEHY